MGNAAIKEDTENTACGPRWDGRECADVQIKQDSPRCEELMRQKDVTG